MQGWRTNMEDAHLAAVNIGTIDGNSISVFGVFDGHVCNLRTGLLRAHDARYREDQKWPHTWRRTLWRP
jgi:serine/threonine protein phosphatase PrpC